MLLRRAMDGEMSILPAMKRAANNWQESYAAGRVTTSLRVMLFQGLLQIFQQELQKVLEEEELRNRLPRIGWMSEGATALTPVWPYYRWDAESRTSVKADRPPLTHEQVQCKMLAMRVRPERLAKSKAVEEAYLQTSFTDWTRRPATWSANAEPAARS